MKGTEETFTKENLVNLGKINKGLWHLDRDLFPTCQISQLCVTETLFQVGIANYKGLALSLCISLQHNDLFPGGFGSSLFYPP